MPSRRRTRSARQKSGSKRYSIEADSAYSPGLSSSEMKGRPTSYGLRRQYSDTVELMMECQEEELLPAQIEAFKREVEEYKEARRKIKVAKDEQMRLEQQQLRQQKLQQQQIAAAPQQNAVSPSSATSQADVVIVGESPPKQMAAAQPAVSTAARLLNPTPQQVYKFVNVPGQTPTGTGNQWVIRPLMQVMPQQNVGNNQLQPRNQAVSIQKSPFMPKRADSSRTTPKASSRPRVSRCQTCQASGPLQYPQYVNPPKKKPRRLEADDIGTLVPLDEYYYGKKEGDPTYQEEKGEHRFKCWYCSKMLYNNVKTMMHMQGHIDSEKQQNLDLSDLTQCKHCYKQFDTPFEMQTHIEKVHMNNTNVLLCRICEKDHESRQSLTSHMRQNHNACEMPYICQLCHFRSSMYSDVVDHFKKKHENSECLLCLYCLKVFHVKFVSQGWGQTQNYYHHLLRHQSKTNAKKCQLCKLTFFNAQEVKAHRKRDHMPNQKGVIGMNAKYTTPDQVMIRVPESGLQPKQLGVKSLNAPAVSKVSEHRGLRYPRAVQELHCFECKMIMATTDHYKKYIQCSMCRFATSCSFAYANHMMGFHSGQITSLSLNIPWERSLPAPMYCLCGFGSRYGNTIANHLVFCTKRSCYKEKPILPPKEDRVDEEQDPRRRPGASLLDVLGLVKKPNIVSTGASEDQDDDERYEKRFTSAAVSEKALPKDDQQEPRDPSIPPELTGARRWLTVKLKDDKTPTKASVFGAGDSSDRAFSPEPEDNSNDATNIDSLVNSALADSEDDEEEPSVSADKDKGDEVNDTVEDTVHTEDEGEKDADNEKEPDKDEDEGSDIGESEKLKEGSGERSIDKEQIQDSDKEAGEKGETSEQEQDSDKDTEKVEKVSDKEAEEGMGTSVVREKNSEEAEEGSDKELEEGMDTSVLEEDTKGAEEGSDEEAEEGIDTSVVEEKDTEDKVLEDSESPQPDNSESMMSSASEAQEPVMVDEQNVQPRCQ
ncbi:LOW QUALITY PROTEIN: zinc finger protein 280D-like [Haliotis rubra]|uniref:LOW QUALITY PROTEIN: zinc finger protein 280D-like n=1 Tax=Haliotis rubra TaxID=36100 RepID=UPI001EE5A7BC|nr:LOW QUALITY PROTEIN: zinc finger protein 280D-like [Haliotis rubra]